MNKLLMGACLTMAMQVGHSQTLPQLGKDPIEKIVAAMTAEEKVSLFGSGDCKGCQALCKTKGKAA